MQSDPQAPQPNQKMLEMSQALAELRDSWVKLSLILGDMMTEQASPLRDEVQIEVQRYLTRLREANR